MPWNHFFLITVKKRIKKNERRLHEGVGISGPYGGDSRGDVMRYCFSVAEDRKNHEFVHNKLLKCNYYGYKR